MIRALVRFLEHHGPRATGFLGAGRCDASSDMKCDTLFACLKSDGKLALKVSKEVRAKERG